MTEQEYLEQLEILQELNPKHSLLPSLLKGYSTINIGYLLFALQQELPVETSTESSIAADDVEWNKLQMRKSMLFGKRAKHSNQFHDCTSDQQRAQVSEQIQIIQRQIEEVMKQITYYEKHGELPKVEEDEKYPVPKDPHQRIMKKLSLAASISRIKRNIKDLTALAKDDPRRNKIPDLEEKLKHYQMHKSYVQRAIDKARI